ncbi:MAG: hypothetical protein IPI39_16725 [Candidatus Obscuribacter sp.]|nr:hypothetical protein [Candidatus Obscuribacter sp.]
MNNDSNTAITTATGTFARFIPYYSLKKLYIALMLYAAVAATIITVVESFYSNFVYASGLTWYTAMAVGWTISFGLCRLRHPHVCLSDRPLPRLRSARSGSDCHQALNLRIARQTQRRGS